MLPKFSQFLNYLLHNPISNSEINVLSQIIEHYRSQILLEISVSFKLNATERVINFPSPWHVSTRSDLQKYLVPEAEVKGSESCILNRL